MTPPVVGVITLENLAPLSLFDHLRLVNAPLSIVSRPGGSNGREADVSVIASLPLVSRVKTSEGSTCGFLMVIVMVVAVMIVPTVGVEREGVDEGTRITVVHGWPCVPSQGPLCVSGAKEKQCHEKFASCHVEDGKAYRCY